MEPEDSVRTERIVAELEEMRREVEDVHRQLQERLSRLYCEEGIAAKCAECARPCKQGASVTVESCPLFRPVTWE